MLLIAALLDGDTLRDYIGVAHSLGLSALVEAHTAEETEAAVKAGARIIGVNNRDLRTFQVDTGNCLRLRPLVPRSVLFVAESGVRTAADIDRLRAGGVDAVLVGETLMRAPAQEGGAGRAEGDAMSLVKICGLTRPEDIAEANEAGPAYFGFVFAPSRRRVTPETAARLRAGLRADIRVVGVFVDAPPGEAEALLQRGIIDIVQLHGRETEEDIRTLKERTGRAGYQGGAHGDAGGRRPMAGLGGRLAAAGQRRGRHRPCLRLDAGGWGEQALFSGRRDSSGQRGRRGAAAAALRGGCEQRRGNERIQGRGKDARAGAGRPRSERHGPGGLTE